MEALPEELKKQLRQVATLIDANETAQALKVVNQILLANPDNIYALLQKSLALLNQGNISEAQSILDAIDSKIYSVNIIAKIEKLNGAIRSKCWRSLPTEIQHHIFSLVNEKYIIPVCKHWQGIALAGWFTLHEELSSSPHFQLWIDIVNRHNQALWDQWCAKLRRAKLSFDPTKAIKIAIADIMPKLGDISWRKWLSKIREVRDKGEYLKKLLEDHKSELRSTFLDLFQNDQALYKAAYQMYWQLRIKPVPEPNEDSIPLGRSKFGGCPDLPESWLANFNTEKGLEIPQLLCQLNIEDIPNDFHIKRLLPTCGTFYVIVNRDHKNNLYSDAQLRFYVPNKSENLIRMRPKGTNATQERHVYKPCRVEFTQILTIGKYSHNLPLFDLTDEEDFALESITNYLRRKYGKHALLGLSTPFQRTYEACLAKYCDEMNLRSYAPASKNGKEEERIYNDYHSDHIICSREYPHRCQDRLLLELETDQDWMFGDDGLMEVTIHQHDLIAQRFDRIKHHFDSH